MFKHLFGPVPSRRLGMSLGVDLVPHKICSFNCIYCECGSTNRLTIERDEYVPVSEVLEELNRYFENNIDPDYITFSGSGEPTLNSGIGRILSYIKKNWPDIPIAVLTNGSLLSDPALRKEIAHADVVLPSLDAVSNTVFRQIDRPFHSLNPEEYIQGLIDFRKEFKGKIWLELMILPGYNDDLRELTLLNEAFDKINPDIIQINTLDRPGTVEGLKSASRKELEEIVRFWGRKDVEIIAAAPERKNIRSYRSDTESAILETIARRPCTLKDLSEILGIHINEINKYLAVLEEEEKIKPVSQDRGVFYKKVM
ncbi:MAG: radical SAM protein [Spirochaetaceae bacterium 4572_59]|nr:MAG: radical SAM protein [Spirochaetaceae bacterium 4572_59]